MERKSTVSMRLRLYVGFSLIIALMILGSVMAYLGINLILDTQKSVYRQEFSDAMDIKDIRFEQALIRFNLMNMMLLTEKSKYDLMHNDTLMRNKNIEAGLQRLLARNKNNPERLNQLNQFIDLQKKFRDTRENVTIPLIYAGKVNEAKKIILGIQADRSAKMQDYADDLATRADKNARDALVKSELTANNTRLGLAIGSLIAVILSMAMAIWIVLNLRAVSRKIKEGVNVLASSASEITASTTQVASGSAETAAAVNQTTTTIEQVKQTSEVSVEKAKYVAEIAKKTVDISQHGKKSMEESIQAMRHIQGQVEAIAGSIVRLSEQSQAIGEIIATVNDLAEQSNLLAVNASIEAAKAGEQGKGFAVVAEEVKSMAAQSKQATAQVRMILGDIQKAMSSAVLATEQGSKAVEDGVKRSMDASESIQKLSESIAESSQAAIQIMSSAQQQLVGMDQVAEAMQNINEASAQNVASTKQAEVAAQDLHQLGQRLKLVTEQYNV